MNKNLFWKSMVLTMAILFISAGYISSASKNNHFDNLGKNSYIEWPYEPDIIVPDDYPSIQDAINVATEGSCICVRNGVYNEPITIEWYDKNGLILCGEDRNKTIIDAENYANVNTINVKNVDDIIITEFTITGSGLEYKSNGYLYDGVSCNSAKNIHIYNNTICDNGNGIYGTGSTSLLLEHNTIIDNLDNGIRGKGDSVFYIRYNTILNNGYGEDPEKQNGDGIEIQSSAGSSTISYNLISGNKMDGIWSETVDNHVIVGNTVTDNSQCGIHIYEGRNCKINDNIVTNNGYGYILYTSGIWLHQSSNNIIDNNTIDDNKNGFCLVQSHENVVTNNKISDNYWSGLELKQTSNNEIRNNIIHDNKIGIYLQSTSQSKINQNDIYLNSLFGLVSIVSTGSAVNNWWGSSVIGPYGKTFRIFFPIIPIVAPWSLSRVNSE